MSFSYKNKFRKKPNNSDNIDQVTRPRMPARDKIMEYLSARDHSELELIRKLKRKEYPMSEIQSALEQVTESGWLKPPDELSEQIANSLSRKKKGISYINKYLRERGLPPIKADLDNELHKAYEIARQTHSNHVKLDKSSRDKLARKLASRGFSMEVIHKTLKKIKEDNDESFDE